MEYSNKTFSVYLSGAKARPEGHPAECSWFDRHGLCMHCGDPKPLEKRRWEAACEVLDESDEQVAARRSLVAHLTAHMREDDLAADEDA